MKYSPQRKEQDIEKIPIADVLSIFIDDRPDLYVDNVNAPKYLGRVKRLNDFWGAKMLSEVTGPNCRAYQKHRGNAGGARRDLEDFRAAIAHHADEGLHRGIVKIKLPRKGPRRDRWLTRSEAARLIWSPPRPLEGRREQDHSKAYRLSFASETDRKDEYERDLNEMGVTERYFIDVGRS